MIRVFVAGDAGLIRKPITRELSRHADIEVVGASADPEAALERIGALRPDVVALEIELPRLDPLAFLEQVMKRHPVPVVAVSPPTPRGGENAVRALALGALDLVVTPGSGGAPSDHELIHAVRAAAAVRRGTLRRIAAGPTARLSEPRLSFEAAAYVIAVGASTGGTQAVDAVVGALPANAPGTVLVQHLPAPFVPAFVKRLDAIAAMQVRLACDGDPVSQGVVLVAPGGKDMVVRREGARCVIRFVRSDPVRQHRPSVNALFESVAESAGRNAVGVLLTGMGTDGARGLLAMRGAGARTFVQDEESCVVFGMPGEALRIGAATEAVPLRELASRVLQSVRPGKARR
ncbi:MAG: chemotaxis-specific protein-glutamate methyltransferase CheB [Gemmatimonadaceae bacterium]|nr:chemotaxis-specific protein-glutamate methyltransferase CheB [Gemmatimonadaceae bacterium]